MQIQLPGFIFHSLKTGPRTPVQHDKSLRSSHFSAETIQQCVDSALPPLPTFSEPFYGLLERRFRGVGAVVGDSRIDTHARSDVYYINVVEEFAFLIR